MSIDDYTGVEGGGAANQFFQSLRRRDPSWRIEDLTMDGCRMADTPLDFPKESPDDVITLTIGGNDLLWNRQSYLRHGLASFTDEYRRLLKAIRTHHGEACLMVGDIYRPDADLSAEEESALEEVNRLIRDIIAAAGAWLVPIHDTFRGSESEYLCFQIEPTLAGAEVIGRLFAETYQRHLDSQSQ